MNIRSKPYPLLLLSICAAALILSCAMGGSTEQGNARISGAVTGTPADGSLIDVQLVAQDYNPYDRRSGNVFTTKTDSSGNYVFEEVPFGSYYLYAFDGKHTHTMLGGPYTIADGEWNPENGTLQKASVISIADGDLSADDSIVYYYIKGTSAVTTIKNEGSRMVSLAGVPAGIHDVMKYAPVLASSGQSVLYTENVEIMPGDSMTVSHMNRPPRIMYATIPLPSVVSVDTVYSIHINAADPDSDTVIYALITQLQSFSLDSVNGLFVWTPQRNELSLRQILIQTSDGKGASAFLKWEFSVKNDAPAPTPQPPAGVSECRIGSTCVFTTESYGCVSSGAQYRFSWGDGDTSEWSEDASAAYSWLRSDTFQVSVQVKCGDFASPSEWSLPMHIFVIENLTPVPSLVALPDMVMLYDTLHQSIYDSKNDSTYEIIHIKRDTIALEVKPLSSTVSPPLYRFYVDGQSITSWTSSTGMYFTPKSLGTYEFSVAAWSDTSVLLPSERSKPYTVVVKSGVLPPPLLKGDTVYQTNVDTAYLKFSIDGDTLIDEVPVYHRFSIFSKYSHIINDTNRVIAQLLVSKKCTDKQFCMDTIPLHNSDTTGLFTGNNILLRLINPQKDYCVLGIQAELSNGMAQSGWNTLYVNDSANQQ